MLQPQINTINENISQLNTDLQSVEEKANTAQSKAEEAESIAKGRATGYVFNTKEDMDLALANEEFTSRLLKGDNLYIIALDVPDYWWDGTQAQELETQKVDLSGYVKDTDYAKDDKGGTVRISKTYQTELSTSGYLRAGVMTNAGYTNASSNSFISKGTLENVIVGKGLVSNIDYGKTDKAGTIKAGRGLLIDEDGIPMAETRAYDKYITGGTSLFISKGTLENVITGKELINKTQMEDYINSLDGNEVAY